MNQKSSNQKHPKSIPVPDTGHCPICESPYDEDDEIWLQGKLIGHQTFLYVKTACNS